MTVNEMISKFGIVRVGFGTNYNLQLTSKPTAAEGSEIRARKNEILAELERAELATEAAEAAKIEAERQLILSGETLVTIRTQDEDSMMPKHYVYGLAGDMLVKNPRSQRHQRLGNHRQ